MLNCLTLCDPMDYSPPGSSVHGILQARIMEWAAIPFSGDLPDPGIKPRSPTLQADALTSEPPGKPNGCESWTIKKAKHWRTDTFELWYWRRHLRVPWTARRSNQSILKEISPGCSLQGLMLKLKLQYFGFHCKLQYFAKGWLIWKDPDVGKEWRQEETGTTEDEMVRWHHQLNGHEFG